MHLLKISRSQFFKQKGSAMTEYAVVLLFMSIVFYWAVIEGVAIEINQNNLPVTLTTPALTQTLADHEENFINTLSMP